MDEQLREAQAEAITAGLLVIILALFLITQHQ